MKLKMSFKNMKHSESLETRIQEKSENFEKYFQGNIEAQWFCWVDSRNEHWAEVKIHGPKFDFFAKASADNMYKALDFVLEKMERQIEKQKHQKRSQYHRQNRDQVYEEEQVYYHDYDETA